MAPAVMSLGFAIAGIRVVGNERSAQGGDADGSIRTNCSGEVRRQLLFGAGRIARQYERTGPTVIRRQLADNGVAHSYVKRRVRRGTGDTNAKFGYNFSVRGICRVSRRTCRGTGRISEC